MRTDQAATSEYATRYAVVRCGLWWGVKTGDGAQVVVRCLTQTGAQRVASALLTAFLDGHFVGARTGAELGLETHPVM